MKITFTAIRQAVERATSKLDERMAENIKDSSAEEGIYLN